MDDDLTEILAWMRSLDAREKYPRPFYPGDLLKPGLAKTREEAAGKLIDLTRQGHLRARVVVYCVIADHRIWRGDDMDEEWKQAMQSECQSCREPGVDNYTHASFVVRR